MFNLSIGPSKLLGPSECMAELVSKQPKNCHFELRLKPTAAKAERKKSSAETGKEDTMRPPQAKQMDRQESILAHMHSLETKNKELQQLNDSLQLQLIDHQDLKKELSSLQDSHTALTEQHQQACAANKKAVQQFQQKLDEASLAKRKAEEQLLLTGSASITGAKDTQGLLDDIQKKYSEEVANLTSDIRVKDKTLQEMRTKRLIMVCRKTL